VPLARRVQQRLFLRARRAQKARLRKGARLLLLLLAFLLFRLRHFGRHGERGGRHERGLRDGGDLGAAHLALGPGEGAEGDVLRGVGVARRY